ncbi:MAG: hypothetical protein FD135_5451, partial [Comamonadaceae bacterium]
MGYLTMYHTDLNWRRLRLMASFVLAICCLPLAALAADPAGVILSLSGKVEIVHGADKRVAVSRAELFSGDSIETGEGQVQVRFVDGTLLTLYRDTRFAVDDYRYAKGRESRAQFSLLNGLMHTLTGQMDKQNYQLKTRLANLGVRGTEYSVKLSDVLHVSVDHGQVEVANAGGKALVSAGQSLTVVGQNVMPKPAIGGKLKMDPHGEAGRAHGPERGIGAGGNAPPPPPPPSGTQNLSRSAGTPAGQPAQPAQPAQPV